MEDAPHFPLASFNITQGYELYQYQPFHDAQRQIRLLTLLPGDKDTDIHIALETVPFVEGESVREYVALSYTWGSAESPNLVHVKDARHDRFILPVTRNLYDLLIHLTLYEQLPLLWIDALCINQQDDAEKSHQVSIMAEIFPCALSVLAWLGPESVERNVAFDVLNRVNANLMLDPETGIPSWRPGGEPGWPWTYGQVVPLKDSEMSALLDLFNSPWFDRAWVWQEALINADHTALMSGSRIARWDDLYQVVNCLGQLSFPPWQGREDLRTRISHIRDLCSCVWPQPILGLLARMRKCLCCDPRDKIYAVLGLQRASHRVLDIKPDYTHSVQEVYVNFVQAYFHRSADLGFLEYAASSAPRLLDLPSFVPDWCSKPFTKPFFERYPHAGTRTVKVSFEADGRHCRATGVQVCQITRLISFPLHGNNPSSKDRENCIFSFFDDVQSVFPDLIDLQIDELCRVVCCEYGQYITYHPTFEETREVILHFMRRSALTRIPSRNLTWAIYRACQHRSLFYSAEGKFGLVSEEAQVEDIVVVFLGYHSLMALHSSDKSVGGYEVVSTAYYDGVMFGEAILGLLPEHYTFVDERSRVPEQKVGPRGFKNLRTGMVELDDPRLPALPPGWEQTAETTRDSFASYRNIDTGEERVGYWNDPRLDPEFLENRGVSFQDFLLV